MKKIFSLTLLTLFLMIFSFVILPVKVFAADWIEPEDWFNHISQFEYGLAYGEIDDVGDIFIVEEPGHEYEGFWISYVRSADWFEPEIADLIESLADDDNIAWYIEHNFDDFDGYLYWNFEQGYWQIEYYEASELDYYIERIEELEDEIEQLENENQQLLDEIQQLENEKQQLENQIQQLETEKQQLENQIQQLETEKQQLLDEIQQLENQISSLENQISSLQNMISSLEDEISTLENQISSLENQISSLEDEISSLENEIQQLENALDLEYERGYNAGYEIGYNEGLLVENNNDITKWFVPLIVIIIAVGIIEPIILIKRRG